MPTSSDVARNAALAVSKALPEPESAAANPGAPRIAIRAEGIGKRYRKGLTTGGFRYRSLREDLTRGIGSIGKRKSRKAKIKEDRLFWALRDVSFDIHEGEAVGIIGRNGAGKSTLLKMVSRITPPTQGRIELHGRVGSLLEVGTGFHPELSGRDNIFLSAAVLGMSRAEITRKLDEIVEFAGVGEFLDTPVKRYSSGMYLRLGFSVAAHLEPDILLVDEVLAVGDSDFQRKCLGKMEDVAHTGRTVLFVSHSMPSILRLCSRVILLDGGKVIADGGAQHVVRTYLDAGYGTSAERLWEDPATAPGDDVVRLRAVRVITQDGEVREDVDIRKPIGIQVEYDDLPGHELKACANVHLRNEDGVLLFISSAFNDRGWFLAPVTPGRVRATCWIPGNYLAEGRVFVEAAISSLNPTHVHVDEPDAVAFQVIDRQDGDGARGVWSGEWPGVVRPLLDWDVQVEDV